MRRSFSSLIAESWAEIEQGRISRLHIERLDRSDNLFHKTIKWQLCCCCTSCSYKMVKPVLAPGLDKIIIRSVVSIELRRV
jgi:hypothetical protein